MAERKRKRSYSTGSEGGSSTSSQRTTDPDQMSLKSHHSMFHPENFGMQTQGSQMSTEPDRMSLRSDRSKFEPINFSTEAQRELIGKPAGCSVCQEVSTDPVSLSCGHRSCKRCLCSEWEESGSAAEYPCPKCGKKCRKTSKHEEDESMSHLLKAKQRFKDEMQKKNTLISEGDGDQRNFLNRIYTKIYITTEETTGPRSEHESRRLERKLTKRASSKYLIKIHDIFTCLSGQDKHHRVVLTKGIAGIGKSIAVQKFILEWSEEKANPSVDFVFSFPFRELNLCTGEKSLHEVLAEFHPALIDLKDSEDYFEMKTIVILDGLDESRLPLDFSSKAVTSVREVTSVSNLIVNLIRGDLLPDANVWITSRPAAASQIPAEYVGMVTEIRGFTDPQKEEYFTLKLSPDLDLAKRITSHIQSALSLNVMCQIPIFCWISAVLFQEAFGGDEEIEIPQTLTEMMAHFLFVQTKRRSRKHGKKTEENILTAHREFLLKLGKLAFDQLLKNNLIFYVKDLEDCGINLNDASIRCGFFNTVLREEKVFSQKQVFFFVHLTVQEFFAALYVYDCFTNNNTTELTDFLNLKDKEPSLLDLLKMTVDKVLGKQNSHLEFFLQFLLGLMVESNRRILKGLLKPPDPSQDTEKKILTYLKSIRRKTISPESCISLFKAMVEMRDHKVKDEIEEYLKLPHRLRTELTPLHCSALAYMLQVSKNDLEVLDLRSYTTTGEGRRRLIPAVRRSRKALLANCNVTAEWVEHLAFALKFPHSPLRELDLSNNDLKDSGVEQLCDGLSSQSCRLKTLRLSGCMVTETGCAHLVKALQSNPSHLKLLDLSYNHPGDSGMKKFSVLKEDPRSLLPDLIWEHHGSHRMKPGFKKYACELTLDPNTAHKNLVLSDENRKVTWVEDEQPHPRHMDRFDHFQQVLCEQGLKGRCYFEMDVLEPFSIGLAYRSIGRKGEKSDCMLGHNDRSWCVTCSDDGCFVHHGKEKTSVASHSSRSSHLGVYLDWEAGTLSFYRVSSDSLSHLHTFDGMKFEDVLYPAVELHTHSSASFRQLT